jgi:hypothetical protein
MRFSPRRSTALMAAAVLSACSSGAPPGQDERAPAPQSFAAFRFPSMNVDRLESPVEPPYAAGSSRGAGLLSSSDPGIVEARPDGTLVAHRNGNATVRSRNGATLSVTVLAARSLQIDPPRLSMQVGTQRTVAVKADGQPVDGRGLRWLTEDPSVAVASGLQVTSGRSPGSATLTAMLGDAKATLTVDVNGSDVPLRISPAQMKMPVGSMRQLSIPDVYAGATQWSTSNAKVLQHLHDGLYVARAKGSAQACATARGERSCAHITVGQ